MPYSMGLVLSASRPQCPYRRDHQGRELYHELFMQQRLQLTKEHRQTFPHDLVKQIASNAACLNGGGHRLRESKDRAL